MPVACFTSAAPFRVRRTHAMRPQASLPRRTRWARMCTTPPSVPSLLTSGDFLDRIRAINRITELATASTQASSLLHLAKDDDNSQVRYAAIGKLSSLPPDALVESDRSEVLKGMQAILKGDSESQCRSGAADVICALRLRDGFHELVEEYARSKDWMVRFSIVAGLGEMGGEGVFEFLKDVVSGGEQEMLIVAAAVGALGELGDGRALQVVQGFLECGDEQVRERAEIAAALLKEGKRE